jgi:PTH1 family peptidyl-tRNA hydrolase
VLARFTAAERELVDAAVGRAADAVEAWVRDGLDAAMNRFNMGPEPPASAGATG